MAKAIDPKSPSFFTGKVIDPIIKHNSGLFELRLRGRNQPTNEWRAAKLFGDSDDHMQGWRLDDSDPEADPDTIKEIRVEKIKVNDTVEIRTDQGHTKREDIWDDEKAKIRRTDVNGNPVYKITYNLNHFDEIKIRKRN